MALYTEFRVFSVLGRGFSVFFSNIVPFGLLAVLVTSPPYIYVLLVDSQMVLGPIGDDSIPQWSSFIGFMVVDILLGSLVSGAVVYGTFQDLRGRRASISDCIGRGLPLIFLVIGVTIVASIAAGLAMLLLVIPGLIVMTMYAVAVPAAVIERGGVFHSLKRSVDLTKGYRWKVFGIIIIAAIIIDFALNIPVGLLSGIVSPTAFVIIVLVQNGIYRAAFGVITAVTYHDLRVLKEGIDVEEIAKVFD